MPPLRRLWLDFLCESVKSLLHSWSCSLQISRRWHSTDDGSRLFDGKNVLIVSESASDVLRSLIHHILRSDVQSLIVVSPDVTGFLQQVWCHLFPEDDVCLDRLSGSSSRLFFQPNDLRDKEGIDGFVENLQQNRQLRLNLHVVLFLTDVRSAYTGLPVLRRLIQRLDQGNLLPPSPQPRLLLVSPDVRRLSEIFLTASSQQELHGLKWMMISDTRRVTIHHLPRLVSGTQLLLFLLQWLFFLWRLVFTMNPDYISRLIITTLATTSTDMFFIYGKPIKGPETGI